MRFLWTYLKKDWGLFFLAPFLMMASVFADLYLPTLMERVVDQGILVGSKAVVYEYGFLMLMVAFVGILSGGLSFIVSAKASARAGERIRRALYEKLMNLSYPELDKFGVASLITRMTNDVSGVQNFLLSAQRSFISAPIMLFGGLIMALRLAPSLSFIFYMAVPFTVLVIALVASRIAKAYPVVQKKLDALNQSVRESLLSIYVIKGFTQEEQSKKSFEASNDDLYRWQLRTQKMMIALSPFLMIAFNFSMVAILWFGGHQVQTGEIAIGHIMAFLTYLSLILNAIIACSFILITYARARASIVRIEAVLKTPISILLEGNKIPRKMSLKFDAVTFTYPNAGEPALKGLSFEVKAGERLGIVGETGSGKSTLLYLASHLYEAQKGEIFIGEYNLKEVSDYWLRGHLRFVEQESTVLSGTIKENLLISDQSASDEALQKALLKAQAGELLKASDRGFSGALNQRGTDLSGGQKQRLSIARALLGEPKILFLDDATSALDALTEKAFLDELDKLEGLTQMIVSQRISTLKRADRILVLKGGEVEAIGCHEVLLKESPTYLAIVESQLGEEGKDE